ncbi:MAG: hypothetical protein AB8B59_03460 [Maribacter sp.]
MKTKFTLLIAFIGISFTSCIKDYYGEGSDREPIEFTSENYLYEGDLEEQFLQEQIVLINAEISELEQTSPNDPDYNDDQAQIAELQQDRANAKENIANIISLGQVGRDFPIPCDQPNGKCIPTKLEYFIFSKAFEQATLLVLNESGKRIGFSERLIDLPGFEQDLQYLRIPVVTDFEKQISVEIIKKDTKGEQTSFKILLDR